MKNLTIIGTSHIAMESVNEVRNAFINNPPDIIALELDKPRFYSITGKKARKVSPFKLGFKFWLLNSIGSWVEKKLGERVGLEPGSEMKTAIRLAKKSNIKIALIDQDIKITINNLISRITLIEKIKLLFEFLKIPLIPFIPKKAKIKINLKRVPSEKIIDMVMAEVKKRFPTIYEVLINERNIYMAGRLKHLQKQYPDSKIIAIIGAGHKKGMEELLK